MMEQCGGRLRTFGLRSRILWGIDQDYADDVALQQLVTILARHPLLTHVELNIELGGMMLQRVLVAFPSPSGINNNNNDSISVAATNTSAASVEQPFPALRKFRGVVRPDAPARLLQLVGAVAHLHLVTDGGGQAHAANDHEQMRPFMHIFAGTAICSPQQPHIRHSLTRLRLEIDRIRYEATDAEFIERLSTLTQLRALELVSRSPRLPSRPHQPRFADFPVYAEVSERALHRDLCTVGSALRYRALLAHYIANYYQYTYHHSPLQRPVCLTQLDTAWRNYDRTMGRTASVAGFGTESSIGCGHDGYDYEYVGDSGDRFMTRNIVHAVAADGGNALSAAGASFEPTFMAAPTLTSATLGVLLESLPWLEQLTLDITMQRMTQEVLRVVGTRLPQLRKLQLPALNCDLDLAWRRMTTTSTTTTATAANAKNWLALAGVAVPLFPRLEQFVLRRVAYYVPHP
jgi:hypothetical protein